MASHCFWLTVFMGLWAGLHCQDKRLTLEDLLPLQSNSYDERSPPKVDGQPTTVYLQVIIRGLDSFNENTMTYSADINLIQKWKEIRFRVPENMTSEYMILDVDWLQKIWHPDLYFKNAYSVSLQTLTVPNHYLLFYKNQTILYMLKVTLDLTCSMNFQMYPHDSQECKIVMKSLTHTVDNMVFKWNPVNPLVLNKKMQLTQLKLFHNSTENCTFTTNDPLSCLEVVFKFKRQLLYHIINTYIPTCLIVIMSWVSFWIKPDVVPARVTLSVASLLTLNTQLVRSQAQLPPVSYIKAVDGYMCICTIFVFMTLMEFCVVHVVLRNAEKCKDVFTAARAHTRALNIDRFSRVFFLLLFTSMNVAYWVYFTLLI